VAGYFLHCCASSVPSRRIEWSGEEWREKERNVCPDKFSPEVGGFIYGFVPSKKGRKILCKSGVTFFIFYFYFLFLTTV